MAWTRALYEEDADQREEGIQVNKDFIRRYAEKVVVYTDHGISPGMKAAIQWAGIHGKPIEYRRVFTDQVHG
jgi:hypothetical protein